MFTAGIPAQHLQPWPDRPNVTHLSPNMTHLSRVDMSRLTEILSSTRLHPNRDGIQSQKVLETGLDGTGRDREGTGRN
jgi:hypothetical protein